MNNYILGPVDTDSISICKQDMSPFSEEEKKEILNELNKLDGELIVWTDDGTYETVIVLKAKNYVLYDGKKVIKKGSSIKDTKRELALRNFIDEIIDTILKKEYMYTEIYNKYVRMISDITDIKPWSNKKTYTEKIDTSERSNESKIKKALEGTDYRPGDKFYVFFDSQDNQVLAENFKGDYNKNKLYAKLYKTAKIFSNIIDIDRYFINYSLKRNQKALDGFIKIS